MNFILSLEVPMESATAGFFYWVVIFEDFADRFSVRHERLAEHFEYLETHRDTIRIAGGLRPGEDYPWQGGLWVLCTETKEQAATLCENDPFFTHGLRRTYSLYQWGRAPCFGPAGSINI